MRIFVVFESMYGNTRAVAEAIASGFDSCDDVVVLSAAEAAATSLESADLVVVGAPTHAHGMSRRKTRQMAIDSAKNPKHPLSVDASAAGIGVREWLADLHGLRTNAAAFDTRIDAPAMFTGRASLGIARNLRRHGASLVAPPESFLVDKESHLLDGELERARAWAAHLTAPSRESGPLATV
jgi:hypothetical protein